MFEDIRPIDPELRAKAEARVAEADARRAAMTDAERDARTNELRLRWYADEIEAEEAEGRRVAARRAASPAPAPELPAPLLQAASPDVLRAAIREVLQEEPDVLRAAVRDALRELAEEQKRDG
jgi:hypothetical protein